MRDNLCTINLLVPEILKIKNLNARHFEMFKNCFLLLIDVIINGNNNIYNNER